MRQGVELADGTREKELTARLSTRSMRGCFGGDLIHPTSANQDESKVCTLFAGGSIVTAILMLTLGAGARFPGSLPDWAYLGGWISSPGTGSWCVPSGRQEPGVDRLVVIQLGRPVCLAQHKQVQADQTCLRDRNS